MRKQILSAGISALAMAGALPALAQTVGNADRENAQAASSNSEIVVTATRREESILNVPVSVQAFSQKQLDEKGIRNIDDLARQTPGVTFATGFSGIKYIAVRGLFSSVGATMTGVYIDDTPVQVRSLSLATNFYPAVFDLDHVEIDRGPQGTLFGAGAMGGVVRYILAQPSLTTVSGNGRAELAFTKGGAPSWEVGAAIGGPLAEDKIGIRISANHRRDGGYVDRVPYIASRGTPQKNSNSRDTDVANVALTLAPTEKLKITPSLFYQKSDRNDTDQYWTIITPTAANPQLPRFINGEGIPSVGRDNVKMASVKAEWDLGGATVYSNTALLDRKTRSQDDGTAYILDILGLPFDLPTIPGVLDPRSTLNLAMTQRSFTQELRLQSNPNSGSRLSYVLGLFYQNSRQQVIEHDTAVTPAAYLGLTGFGPEGDLDFAIDHSRDRQWAAFGNLDYKLTDKLTVSAGVRVARMEFDFLHVGGGPFNNNITTVNTGRSKETPVTPKFNIEYKPNDKLMVYASAAKGYRQGGANPLANTVTCAADLAAIGLTQVPLSYKSDSVWSYEVGAKGQIGRAVTFAASAFDIEWNNIQRPRALLSCAAVFIDNLGKARSRGFDALITVRPLRGLSLDANLGYMDVRQAETVANPAGGANIATSGDRFAIPWQVSLSADYETELSSNLKAYGRVQYDWKAGYDVPTHNVQVNPILTRVNAQNFVSARIGLRRSKIDLSLFVDNLTNSNSILGKLNFAPSNRLLYTSYRPRTIGGTATYRF